MIGEKDDLAELAEDLLITVDSKGTNVLDAIVMAGQVDLLNVVIDAASKMKLDRVLLHRQSPRGYTLLHRAVLCCNMEMATRLVQLGADTTVKDRSGRTPLDVAELMHTDPLILVSFRNLLST